MFQKRVACATVTSKDGRITFLTRQTPPTVIGEVDSSPGSSTSSKIQQSLNEKNRCAPIQNAAEIVSGRSRITKRQFATRRPNLSSRLSLKIKFICHETLIQEAAIRKWSSGERECNIQIWCVKTTNVNTFTIALGKRNDMQKACNSGNKRVTGCISGFPCSTFTFFAQNSS